MNNEHKPFSSGDAIALGAPTAGRMSKQARKAAIERLRVELFGQDGMTITTCPQPSERDALLAQAKGLRDLAARGMSPRKYNKEADRLESLANEK